jgi:hypothetical protein
MVHAAAAACALMYSIFRKQALGKTAVGGASTTVEKVDETPVFMRVQEGNPPVRALGFRCEFQPVKRRFIACFSRTSHCQISTNLSHLVSAIVHFHPLAKVVETSFSSYINIIKNDDNRLDLSLHPRSIAFDGPV